MAEYIAQLKVGNELRDIRIVAPSHNEALSLSRQQGRVITLRRTALLSSLIAPGMKPNERIIFLRRLSTMTRSKVGIGAALRIMRDTFSGAVSRVSEEILRGIESDKDFGSVVASMPRDWPKPTAALIRSGMRGGDMQRALDDAALFEKEMQSINQASSSGLLTAIGSFLVAAITIIGSVFYVGPFVMQTGIIRAAGDSVDVAWVFTLADLVAYALIGITAALLGLIILAFIGRKIAPRPADRLILKIPVYRDLVLSMTHYTIFYGMSLLVKSGVRMEETLQMTQEAAPPGEMAEDLRRAVELVRSGVPWANALQTIHPTDRAALSSSHDREQVAESLDAVAQSFKMTHTERVQQVVPALKMLAALFMALGGALVFGMVMLPSMQASSGFMQ